MLSQILFEALGTFSDVSPERWRTVWISERVLKEFYVFLVSFVNELFQPVIIKLGVRTRPSTFGALSMRKLEFFSSADFFRHDSEIGR